MNVNLGQCAHPEPLQEEIEEHQQIMRHAGYTTIGPAVLIPEGPFYPGSYQVWNPIEQDDDFDRANWVYIDPEGVPHFRDELPTSEELRGK